MKKLEELGISPAPWRVITVNGRLHSVEASPCFIGDLMHIATVCNLRKARPSDARLIAAAPELYDSLCEFVRYAERHAPLEAGLNPIIDKARAALRLCRGRHGGRPSRQGRGGGVK